MGSTVLSGTISQGAVTIRDGVGQVDLGLQDDLLARLILRPAHLEESSGGGLAHLV